MISESEHQIVHKELAPHYLLLNLADIEPFPSQELKSLAHRLEAGLQLDPTLRQIHQQLLGRSDFNKQQKIGHRKKGRKLCNNGAVVSSKPQPQPEPLLGQLALNQPESALDQSSVLLDESVMVVPLAQKQTYCEGQTLKGKIWEGRLLIKLPVKLESEKHTHQEQLFEVRPTSPRSSISAQSLTKITLKKAVPQNMRSVRLTVITVGMELTVVGQSEGSGGDVLGMDFLQLGGVLLNCNYRPQTMSFTLTPSSIV